MTITEKLRERGTLFSKQTKIVKIAEVTPADARELAQTLRRFFVEHGHDSHYEIYISGETVNEVAISGSDHWKSNDDCNHFLFGFELAMTLSGIDVTPGS